MDAPIDVQQYAVARRKALAQKVASMFGAKVGAAGGARGKAGFSGMNPQQNQQFTFPYLQNPARAMGLGVVNPGNPADPYGNSIAPGQAATPPGGGALGALPPTPIMGPAPPILPQQAAPAQQAGGGSYGGGAPGGGFYGGEAAITPPVQNDLLRTIMGPQAPNPYMPYGGQRGSGSILRF